MMGIIKPVNIITREWSTETLCQELQFPSINQLMIKLKLLKICKDFLIKYYPLHELVTESSKKYISKSNLITRSNMNNTLRPNLGNKLTTNSLLGQGIYLWNLGSNEFKNTTSYYKAKRLAKPITLGYIIK